jgi:hypothetical protein
MQPFTEPDSLRNLHRLHKHKQVHHAQIKTLGVDLVVFFKKDIQRKQTRFGQIADVWQHFIPETMIEHTCLESFHAGTLKVLVDSSSHLYEMRLVLSSGLEKQIIAACRGAGLRKITLKLGRWYDGEEPNQRRVNFQ